MRYNLNEARIKKMNESMAIDYKKANNYKDIDTCFDDETGPRQKKNGVVKIRESVLAVNYGNGGGRAYVIHDDKIVREAPSGLSKKVLKDDIKNVDGRTKSDWEEIFNIIIDDNKKVKNFLKFKSSFNISHAKKINKKLLKAIEAWIIDHEQKDAYISRVWETSNSDKEKFLYIVYQADSHPAFNRSSPKDTIDALVSSNVPEMKKIMASKTIVDKFV